MPFLAKTLDNADPLFVLEITPGFYLHHVEKEDQDPQLEAVYMQIADAGDKMKIFWLPFNI